MSRVSCLLLFLMLLPTGSALADWYEEEIPPPPQQLIVDPFTFKGFDLASGGSVTTWMAPGTDPELFSLGFLVSGGYKFESAPVYIGLEVPLGFLSVSDADMSQFAIGNVGLGVKGRLDPNFPGANLFTGWTLDLYLPTAWIPDDENAFKVAAALGYSGMLSLIPNLYPAESIGLALGFDLVLPGEYLFFQLELRAATIFPITDTDVRDIYGGLLWGVIVGYNIIDAITCLVELKAMTPFNVTDPATQASAPTHIAISPGFRFDFGVFKPAVWVSFPLNEEYREAFPDVIIGLDLSLKF